MRSGTRLPREWDLAVEIVGEHWFDLYVRGDAAAVRTLLSQLPRNDSSGRRARRGARMRGARRRRHRSRRRHLEHAEAGAGAASRDAAGTWRPGRSAGLAKARLEGDFEAALRPRTGCWPRPPGTPAVPKTALARRSYTRCSGRPPCGRTASSAPGGAQQGPLARAHRLDFVALSALSYLALLDVMVHGPADEQGHGLQAIELAADRGWSRVPQTACARAGLALHAFYDCGRPRPPSISSRRALPPRCCGAASWTS